MDAQTEEYLKGPWLSRQVDNTTWAVYSEEHGRICNINQYPNKQIMPDELCEATAKFIAAAPDLLAVVERLVYFKASILAGEFHPESVTLKELFDSAEAAIAKATS